MEHTEVSKLLLRIQTYWNCRPKVHFFQSLFEHMCRTKSTHIIIPIMMSLAYICSYLNKLSVSRYMNMNILMWLNPYDIFIRIDKVIKRSMTYLKYAPFSVDKYALQLLVGRAVESSWIVAFTYVNVIG